MTLHIIIPSWTIYKKEIKKVSDFYYILFSRGKKAVFNLCLVKIILKSFPYREMVFDKGKTPIKKSMKGKWNKEFVTEIWLYAICRAD